MAAKTKLFKGFKYLSQIFDEGKDEEEDEIQIGFPTDVKHVSHIGANGPAAESPSWMKDFKSAPLSADSKEETAADNQCTSEDAKSKRGQKGSGEKKERSKQHRRHHSTSGASDSADAAAAGNLPDIPKKSRRKKSKEETRSKPRPDAAGGGPALPPLSGSNH